MKQILKGTEVPFKAKVPDEEEGVISGADVSAKSKPKKKAFHFK